MLLPGPSDHSLDTTARPRRAFLLTLAFLRTKTNGRMTFKRLSIGIKNTMNTSRRRDQSGPAMKRLRDSLQTKISKIIFSWTITIEKHFVFIVTLPIVVEEPTKEALQVCLGLYGGRVSRIPCSWSIIESCRTNTSHWSLVLWNCLFIAVNSSISLHSAS